MATKHITIGLLLAAAGAAQAVTLVSSDFDSGSEGWVAVNGATAATWVPSGGVTGGYIQATDSMSEQIWLFQAPTAWLGDRSAAIGGTIDWSLKVSTLASPMTVPYADIKIGSGSLVLAAEAGPSPGLDWTSYSVSFNVGQWRVGDYTGELASAQQIAAVLSNLEFLRIRGEFSGAIDTGGLDHVVMSAVPELPTAALALAGIALLGLARRRTNG